MTQDNANKLKSRLIPVTQLINSSPSSKVPRVRFEQLLKKLLNHDGSVKGYIFKPEFRFGGSGIHGVVSKNYPGMKCPAAFYFKWSRNPINKGTASQQIRKSFENLLKSKMIKSYVLVMPHDLKDEEKKWLDELPNTYNTDVDIYHYGDSQIQKLLDGFPALKKYYYSRHGHAEDIYQDFIEVKKKYNEKVYEEFKHLHFVGLPTGNYQKQFILTKPELAKVYIPLEFSKRKDDRSVIKLHEILKKSNRVVILGNPGSGKTTLAKYLALTYSQKSMNENKTKTEQKTPFIIPVREFGRKQKENSQSYDFIDYLKYAAETDYGLNHMEMDFFIALLEMGEAIVLFDGLDEVSPESRKIQIAKNIEGFSRRFLDSTIWITSRIVGYTGRVMLKTKKFDHYCLTEVSREQARGFIKKWYEVQIPQNKALRAERIKSLKQAIEENPGVRRLKSNPLLLTMMTLVHQFEGTLPDNRTKLYEKCIELLLKTWQEQKFDSLEIKNPMEERGLKYDTQLRLMAAAAFYIQKKTLEATYKGARGLIEEKELSKVLFENRFDKKRMSKENAKKDIRIFLDYIRDRAGLLVEKGKNLFSFVHISFLEYLSAYQIAEDRSKSQKEHIHQLIRYLGNPGWEEPILLALHLFTRSTGPSFIDAFTAAVFTKLSDEYNPSGWFLMGRAVRDNINVAPEDSKQIIREIVNIWLEDSENNTAFSILKEIVRFSGEGEKILKEMIRENIKNNPANKAFKSLYLYKNFYGIDSSIPGFISKNKDYADLLAYLPVYRNAKVLEGYIEEKLGADQWVIFFNSASDKTLENLDSLLQGGSNPQKLKGYLLSSWQYIFEVFRDRCRILDQNRDGADVSIHTRGHNIQCDFALYAKVHLPIKTFKPFTDILVNSANTIAEPLFLSEDKKRYTPPGDEFIGGWINKIVRNILGEFKNHSSLKIQLHQDDTKYLAERMSYFGGNFLRDFLRNNIQNLIREFLKDLIKGSSRDFLQRFIRLLNQQHTNRETIRSFLRDFNRYFIRNLTSVNLREFNLELLRYFNLDSLRDFIRNFLRDRIQNLTQSFEIEISRLYRKKYKKKFKREDLSEKNCERLYNLFIDEFTKGHPKFIKTFFLHLYEYLFYDKFEVSLETVADSPDPQSFSVIEDTPVSTACFLISNPFMIPFTFGFLLTAPLNHYLIDILTDLRTRFYKRDEIDMEIISKTIDGHCAKNPFILYLLNFSWDFYAKDFNKTFQTSGEDDLNNLRLAVFIVNAAKVTLTTGMPCKGNEWEKTLEKAQKIRDSDLFVNISLALYNLCNFQERKKNSKLLKNLLEKFKQDYPENYQLMGFL